MQHFVELSFLQCSYCGILSTFYVVGICPVGFCLVGFCPVGFCPVGFCPGFIHIKCDMNVLDSLVLHSLSNTISSKATMGVVCLTDLNQIEGTSGLQSLIHGSYKPS